jgi:hypothetical protein
MFKTVKRWMTPEPVVVRVEVPVLVPQPPVRLVTIKDVALFHGWPEDRTLSDGSRIGKEMADRYRQLTGEEPSSVPQEINGRIRYVFGYPQEVMPLLGSVWRSMNGGSHVPSS